MMTRRSFSAIAVSMAVVWSLSPLSVASATIPDFAGPQAPSLAPLLREVTPAVVNISVRGRVKEENPLYQDPVFRQFFDVPKQLERQVKATGAGVIGDAEGGYGLTNNHVVEHASSIQIATKDGQRFNAKVVGRDPPTDVAVIQIQNGSGLKALPLGDSDKLEVGDFVVAIGNPFGLGQTVTSGIVSALGRSGLGIEGYEDFIQTDASINPGNSGGALVDLRGQLMGINTAILGPSGGNVGIGFAVPANIAKQIMADLIKNGDVKRGQIGIRTQDQTPDIASSLGLERSAGALIAQVAADSAAAAAGLQAGDLIVGIDTVPVHNVADLHKKID